MKLSSLLFVSALVACGNDHGEAQQGPQPDGPPGPDAGVQLHDLALRYRGATPVAFAYRNGRGEWHQVEEMAGSGSGAPPTYLIHATSDFLVAVACTNGDSFDVELVGGLVGDGTPSVSCLSTGFGGGGGGGGGGSGTTHALTGSLSEAGSVAVRTTVATGSGAWQFHFDEPNGTYDVAALDASGSKMALVRGVTVSGADLAVPAIDLATDGTATVAEPLDISGADPSATFTSTLQLTTATARTTFPATTGKVAHRVPESLLTAGDQQAWTFAATSGNTTQSARVLATGSEALPHISLIPPPSAVSFGEVSGFLQAGYDPLPDDPDTGSLRLTFTQAGLPAGVTQKQGITVSLGWLAQNPRSTDILQIDTSFPGFDPAWALKATSQATLSRVHTDIDGTQYTSSVSH